MTTATRVRAETAVSSADVERFIELTVADYRARLALLADGGDRRAVEDAVALLTDYRLSGMDADALARLIATLRAGRSPVWMRVLRAEAIGAELARRWDAARSEASAPARD
ncbi:MAG TPA: hypothetical protein VFC53_11590 [Dehalococcoidia bacterium]|nr:hypothetical protein [Dehalococcoidia bacterium]